MTGIFFITLLFAQIVSPITHQNGNNDSIGLPKSNIFAQEYDHKKSQINLFSQPFRIGASTFVASKKNSSLKSSFLDRGSTLSLKLRQMANAELGVTFLQDVFNSLPYDTYSSDEDVILIKMVETLDSKLKLYINLITEMIRVVEESYSVFKERRRQGKSNNMTAKNLILDFSHGRHGINEQQQEYYPCCVIPDHYLMFDPHFGTRVNTELWCDSGLEQERFHSPFDLFFAPVKLTELFSMNHHKYPNLKWQFFMSASNVHTEFPAHRPGTSIGSDCGQSSRHHQIYEKTIRPRGRNILLLYDIGQTLGTRLLLTARSIGHYIVDTLTEKDEIAVLAVADSVFSPTQECMRTKLVSATHAVKFATRRFIDYLEIRDARTNHSLGFMRALDLIYRSTSDNHLRSADNDVLLIYITRGLQFEPKDVESILRSLGKRIDTIRGNVVISVFNLGIPKDGESFETQSLNYLVSQNYAHYGISVRKRSHPGEVLNLPTTLRVAPLIKGFYDVVQNPKDAGSKRSDNVTISDVYWDEDGAGMVLTFSKTVFDDNEDVIGVVGIDVSLAHLLEDATYFISSDSGYVIVSDREGNALGHPKIGRPELLTSPLLKTPTTILEDSTSFAHLAPHMLLLSSGHISTGTQNEKDGREYWYRRCDSFGWIFILSRKLTSHFEQKLSSESQPLPPEALFHRLDLLSPQEARVCRHFNQMATLDGATIFLSPGTYSSPLTYLANSYHNLNMDVNEMAHLKGETHSVRAHHADIMRESTSGLFDLDRDQILPESNLKEGVKSEASALYKMAPMWKDLFRSSKLQKYIIRRYGTTKSGVMLMYPGTLLEPSYDPTAQAWYVKATQSPGHLVVSPPFLDPGGAGYIISVSHTIYQGRSASLHSPSDPTIAVVAADFTLGYWHKLLADIEPLCANSIFFKDLNYSKKESGIRCFLMDVSGYLIAHPSFLDPSSLKETRSNIPRHITHQEPWLSMSLLGKSLEPLSHEPITGKSQIFEKIWCAKQWRQSSERFYRFNIRLGQLITSDRAFQQGQMKKEGSCLQYKLVAVPSSNLILGIINQTCSSPTSFCPCSTVDRPCLNCQLMEKGGCECPCECTMISDPCSERLFTPLTLQREGKFRLSSMSANSNESEDSPPQSCPPNAETPSPLHYGVGMLAQLNVCRVMRCDAHAGVYSCMGVLDCVWCALEGDARTPLDAPYCTHAHKCYGGIRGGPSPYPPGLAPMPRSERKGSVLPILPVVGGVIVVFLVMGVTIYFYRVYAVGAATSGYTPSSLHSHAHTSPFYPIEAFPDLEHGDNFLDERIVSAEATAAMSPYRMNPTYCRPTANYGDVSDHGYSTMTPHEESDNLTELVASSKLFTHNRKDERLTSLGFRWFDQGRPSQNGRTEMIEMNGFKDRPSNNIDSFHTLQSPISSPKKIGPNRLIVPVTVHMVDTM